MVRWPESSVFIRSKGRPACTRKRELDIVHDSVESVKLNIPSILHKQIWQLSANSMMERRHTLWLGNHVSVGSKEMARSHG